MNEKLLKAISQITDEEKRLLSGGSIDKSSYSSTGDFVIDSAHLVRRGKPVTVRTHTRFTDFPRHTHNYIEIIYMCKGKTVHTVNDTCTIELKEGELLFLNNHASHCVARAEREDIAVNLIVLPEFFERALQSCGGDNPLSNFLLSGLSGSDKGIDYLHFKVADILPVQNLMENIIWSFHKKQANNRTLNEATLGLLFLHLLNFTHCLDTGDNTQVNNALVVAVLHEIEENYKNARLDGVAAQYNVSVAYLSRLVRQITGKTFKELLVEKRFLKAAKLLRETRLTVADIAAAVGYENISYFHRTFLKRYGISPSQYRIG